ncbi:hypothetical protein Q3G72_015233 [Acer saccharum]|nr:hypothetical protein Q3G72_015233 [Acer saccharum]
MLFSSNVVRPRSAACLDMEEEEEVLGLEDLMDLAVLIAETLLQRGVMDWSLGGGGGGGGGFGYDKVAKECA